MFVEKGQFGMNSRGWCHPGAHTTKNSFGPMMQVIVLERRGALKPLEPQSDAGGFYTTWTFAKLMQCMTGISNRLKPTGCYGFAS